MTAKISILTKYPVIHQKIDSLKRINNNMGGMLGSFD